MVMTMNKGQFTVIGLVMIFVSLLVLSALYPTIMVFIDAAKACATSSADLVFDIIPLLLPLAIVISIIIYATAQRQQPQY